MATLGSMTRDSTPPNLNAVVVQFGPLCYRIVGRDDWGARIVKEIRAHLGDPPPDAVPHLTLHAVKRGLLECSNHGKLPPELRHLLPSPIPSTEWHPVGDDMGGQVWRHPHHWNAVWNHFDFQDWTPPLFPLPWCCLLQDIVGLGGALVHSALVACDGRGLLLAAQAGGGKSTAAGRLPADWNVLADDAALVYSDGADGYWASPLPTWGFMKRGKSLPPALQRWSFERRARIAGLCLLRKGPRLGLRSAGPLEAAREMYERFSEHPCVCVSRFLYREHLFRFASSLSRAVPAWELELDMTSPYWDLLRSEVTDHVG